MIEARGGPSVTVSGADLVALDRQLRQAVAMFRARDGGNGRAPYVLLQLAIEVNRLVNGSAPELRNSRRVPPAPSSDQPVTLTTAEAAEAAEVSESYLRRLVRDGVLEVRASQGPGYALYADSFAAWQERRRRRETDQRAA